MRKSYIIVAVIVLIVLGSLGFLGYNLYSVSKELKKSVSEMELLQKELDGYENVIPIYRLKESRLGGTEMKESDFEEDYLPADADSSIYITDLSKYKGWYYIADFSKTHPLTKDVLMKDSVAQTDKYYDVYLDVVQIDARSGSFVEINYVDPSGGKETIFGKKHVKALRGQMATMSLSAEELSTLYDAYTSLYLTPGATIQSALYVQPSMQKSTTPFYAPSEAVLRVMDIDPNITAKVLRHITERNRNILVANSLLGEDETKAVVEGRNSYIEALFKAMDDAVKTNTSGTSGEVGEGESSNDYSLEGEEIIAGVDYEENIDAAELDEFIEGGW